LIRWGEFAGEQTGAQATRIGNMGRSQRVSETSRAEGKRERERERERGRAPRGVSGRHAEAQSRPGEAGPLPGLWALEGEGLKGMVSQPWVNSGQGTHSAPGRSPCGGKIMSLTQHWRWRQFIQGHKAGGRCRVHT
jgi:hypothetical protein